MLKNSNRKRRTYLYAYSLNGEPTTIIRTGALLNIAVQHPNSVAVGFTYVADNVLSMPRRAELLYHP